MPYEHGRTYSINEKHAERRICSTCRRSVEQDNYRLCPKELASRGSEQRLPLFTIIFVDTHASRKVSPFPSPFSDTFRRKNLESVCPSNMDGLEPLSPRMLEVGPQAANTDSARLNSSCIASEASSLGQSVGRNKLSNSPDSLSSTSLAGSLTLGNSPGSVYDNLSAIGSDFLVDDTLNVDKRVKRNPREKGKKKGKQYQQTASRKDSTESNVQCDESIYSTSGFGTSKHSSLSSLGKHLLDNKLSDEATPPSLWVTDITSAKDDSANSNEFVDCSTTLLSSTSYTDEMDDLDSVPSPQRFAGEECGCNTTYLNSSSTTKYAEIVPVTSGGKTKEVHFKENNIFHDNSSSISMDNYNSVVYSSLEGSNSDVGENSSDDIVTQLLVKDESGPSSSEGEIVSPSVELVQHDTSSHTVTVNLCNVDTERSKNCYSSDASIPNDVLDACSSTERADCSSQAGSSNDFHPVLSGKRGRKSRRMIGNGSLNGANRSFSRTGKDNNYSIWQKVQKTERKEAVSKPNDATVLSSHTEVPSKDAKTKMKLDEFIGIKQKQCGITHRCPCSDEISKIDRSQVAANGPKTGQHLSKSTVGNSVNSVKSKCSSTVKQANQYYRSGSYTGKSDMHKALRHHVQQKEGLHNSSLVTLNKDSSFSQRSLVKPTGSMCCQAEPEKEMNVPMEEVTPPRNVCNGVCSMNLPDAYGEIDQVPSVSNQFGWRQIEANSESGTTKYRESSSLLNGTGTPIQKWVPVGRKDLIVSDTGNLDNVKVSVMDEAVLNQSYSEVAEVEVLSSNNAFSTPNDGEFSYPRANKLTNKLSNCPHSAEVLNLHSVINCQTDETQDKDFIGVETDLDKIIQAVNDAYKLQTAAEGVQLVTGSPVADFEKFLFFASPVIGQTQYRNSCNSCSGERLMGNSLCWHQIPNVCLKSIWQWYEEPGCFGLEVRARDYYNSRRLHNGRFEFTAYFVPYLSAVQLFGKSRSTRYCNMSAEAAIPCEVDKTEKSLFSLGSLPILSMLLPKPSKDTGAWLSESSSENGFFDKSIHVGHEELIFQYFESDHPPWRRPLYEKIKELVTGDKLSDSRIFGDPVKLDSVKLRDLHPASWYCVAWYPIYRVPDGNFHAAFLTYHSLGHFGQRSAPGSVPGAFTTVVSPVVGLQTYKDKGENWFQLRDMDSKVVQSEDSLYPSTSELMEERLRTLKQTASAMARAVVSKGSQRSANRHPDYEFFVSRSW